MSHNQCFVMRRVYGTSLFSDHIKARRATWSGSFISHERCLYQSVAGKNRLQKFHTELFFLSWQSVNKFSSLKV